ncbi:MAG: SDR family NAD(P)-dependent oxidoreductase [Parasphingorhabdus sp.]|uniref:SDR family NAD(P)-dependent oxidoreductase n=1 Tax=Parasphingorhabdus sp. TaxID=2709688 RepID=UPI003296F978
MDFNGKTAVITGGATGIGFALAKQMGLAGARVILFEPRENRLQEAAEILTEMAIDAKYLAGDVAQLGDVEALADFAWTENGRADILVNNAGIGGGRASVIDMDMDEARRLYEVNFWGVWNGISTFAKRFREDGGASAIYTTASENSLFNALPKTGGAYVSGKHALLGLMDVLRREVPDTIKLGVIIPGWVKSELSDFQAGEAMDTDDFAALIFKQMQADEYYLVSHPYNVVRMQERWAEVYAAFEKYAPRQEGDDQMDVQLWFERMRAARGNS